VTISQTAPQDRAGTHAHVDAVRASVAHGKPQDGRSSGATARNMTAPRRMVAVTVALSEPADGPEVDWADTLAANLRLLYSNSTVEIIDTWRVDR